MVSTFFFLFCYPAAAVFIKQSTTEVDTDLAYSAPEDKIFQPMSLPKVRRWHREITACHAYVL